MAVEGGMKCVKFLLYILLLVFCVSGEKQRWGRVGARVVRVWGTRSAGSWRPNVEGELQERAEGSPATPCSFWFGPRMSQLDVQHTTPPPLLLALPVW